ncbi:hypothetical protein MG293_019782 [Ovis ammon polii]|uniref:Uncharacterized protein n=1 Tax=Ovis ammon polii TaxID=230172 RepID=A0AAD4TN02_OVIAM|nr:hypothetical protein MG293_019782 [Ovis ammon polii]KAI4553133.1 hypothetical protein MJT46_016427 [Ovis ammon polii x Ovis aries]
MEVKWPVKVAATAWWPPKRPDPVRKTAKQDAKDHGKGNTAAHASWDSAQSRYDCVHKEMERDEVSISICRVRYERPVGLSLESALNWSGSVLQHRRELPGKQDVRWRKDAGRQERETQPLCNQFPLEGHGYNDFDFAMMDSTNN